MYMSNFYTYMSNIYTYGPSFLVNTFLINILLEKGFDINNETPVMKFYSSIKKMLYYFLKNY